MADMADHCDLGLIGLAVMGQNLILNMADHGFRVAAYNRTTSKVDEFLAGNHDRAIEMHYKLLPLVEAMFYETNPIPVKTALALMGKISGELRLPLCEMSEANKERLTGVMEEYGLV